MYVRLRWTCRWRKMRKVHGILERGENLLVGEKRDGSVILSDIWKNTRWGCKLNRSDSKLGPVLLYLTFKFFQDCGVLAEAPVEGGGWLWKLRKKLPPPSHTQKIVAADSSEKFATTHITTLTQKDIRLFFAAMVTSEDLIFQLHVFTSVSNMSV